MAPQRLAFILSSAMVIVLVQVLALSSISEAASVASGNRTDNSTSEEQNLLHDLQTAASENNVQFQGVSASSFSSKSGAPNPGYAAPVPSSGYNLPAPPASGHQGAPVPPPVGGFPVGGLGFGFPGFGGNIGLDISGGGYYPIVEKAIVVIGGGILLLVILAIIQASAAVKGGYLNNMFGGDGIWSGAGAGLGLGGGSSVSASASASAAASKNVQLSSNVANSINKQF